MRIIWILEKQTYAFLRDQVSWRIVAPFVTEEAALQALAARGLTLDQGYRLGAWSLGEWIENSPDSDFEDLDIE
jgi:hypothetical protein